MHSNKIISFEKEETLQYTRKHFSALCGEYIFEGL